jgi:RNA polymerase sigma-70 factor (ECF subfamily)
LGELCEAYWSPVFRFVCRAGHAQDTARDLTQEFFARLLAKHGLDTVQPGQGRFRSFLLGAVKHFLADEFDRARAAKRGGGQIPVPLETGSDTSGELPVPDPAGPVPDTYFDRQWAVTLVERALEGLAAEFAAPDKNEQFQALKPFLLGEVASISQAEVAEQLAMTEGAVKVAIHRMRKRFRDRIKTEIAQTVEDTAQVQEEWNYLLEALSQNL